MVGSKHGWEGWGKEETKTGKKKASLKNVISHLYKITYVYMWKLNEKYKK